VDVVKFIEPKFNPASFDPALAGNLIGQLDDDEFDVRDKAASALCEMGTEVVPLLEKRSKDPSLEVRTPVKQLLDGQLGVQPTNPKLRRELRSISALERMNTPEAITLLERLSKNPTNPRVADEAKAAFGRSSGKP